MSTEINLIEKNINTAPKSKTKIFIGVGIGLLVVAIIIFIIVYYKNNKNKKSTPKPTILPFDKAFAILSYRVLMLLTQHIQNERMFIVSMKKLNNIRNNTKNNPDLVYLVDLLDKNYIPKFTSILETHRRNIYDIKTLQEKWKLNTEISWDNKYGGLPGSGYDYKISNYRDDPRNKEINNEIFNLQNKYGTLPNNALMMNDEIFEFNQLDSVNQFFNLSTKDINEKNLNEAIYKITDIEMDDSYLLRLNALINLIINLIIKIQSNN